ncbi:hypothetical protein GTX53_09055 [Streptomyces sp. SID5594]|uniref:hypothetical protein n=1 Tax=unclassified Streptomyces TaxID=2593676 RepID=UPI00039B6EC7|nr:MULTISPECIES: hypothetical protein [unclassified Streptomyces]MZF53990.1 hypothetical protein [Streptomyces sp. SID5594]
MSPRRSAARTTGAAVELAPTGALATKCYYKVNATGGPQIRSGPGTTYSVVGSYANGAITYTRVATSATRELPFMEGGQRPYGAVAGLVGAVSGPRRRPAPGS